MKLIELNEIIIKLIEIIKAFYTVEVTPVVRSWLPKGKS